MDDVKQLIRALIALAIMPRVSDLDTRSARELEEIKQQADDQVHKLFLIMDVLTEHGL